MPQFTVEYTATEITRERTVVEADTPEEAVRLVEEYEHDNSSDTFVSSLSCEFSDAKVVPS